MSATAPVAVRIDARRERAGLAALHAGFFVTGIVTVLLGPVLPALMQAFAVGPAQAGTLFVAQFLGSSAGSLLSQIRPRFSIPFGLSLVMTGVALLPMGGLEMARVAAAIFGFGLGQSIAATNMTVSYTQRHRRAAALNILNMMWGVGAATSPVLIEVFSRALGLRGCLWLIAGLVGAVLAMVLITGVPRIPPRGPAEVRSSSGSVALGVFVYCVLLWLYIGTESAIGGWLAAMMKASGHAPALVTTAVVAFWIALLGGRALAPMALRRMSEARLLWSALFVAGAATITLIALPNPVVRVAAAFAAGLGCAPVFALHLSALTNYVEQRAAVVPGWFFALAATGGATFPWLCGQLVDVSGSYRVAYLVPLATVVLSLAILAARARIARQDPLAANLP